MIKLIHEGVYPPEYNQDRYLWIKVDPETGYETYWVWNKTLGDWVPIKLDPSGKISEDIISDSLIRKTELEDLINNLGIHSGRDGRDGVNGADGQDGQDGKDGRDGISYRSFVAYAGFVDAGHLPVPPAGGNWDVQTDTFTFRDPGNEGWGLIVPSEELNIWMSTTTFNSLNEKVEDWTPPVRYNGVVVSVEDYTRYYKASNSDESIDVPNVDVDPTTVGWSLNGSDAGLSAEKPFLWCFDRISYTDGNIYQTGPYIIRRFDEVTAAEVREMIDTAVEQIESDLNDTNTRLSTVEGNYAVQNIDSEDGLIEIITNYEDENQKSFADIIIDAGDASIRQKVGSEVENQSGKTLTAIGQELNAVDGKITTAATQAINTANANTTSAINDARTEWNAADASITQSVSKSHYCWVLADGSQEDYNFCHKTDSETYEQYEARVEETHPNAELKVIIDEMSAIKQQADRVSIVVADDDSVKASVIVDAINNGEVIISADKINLNGSVIATAIETGGFNVANKTTIDSNGVLKAIDAQLEGNIYAGNGFFGKYTYDISGHRVIPEKGVYIGSYGGDGGLYSSNFFTSESTMSGKGFGLFGNKYFFYADDGSYITSDGIVAKKVSSTLNGYTTSIDENGFHIKKGDEVLAEFIVDPDNNDCVCLRIKGRDGWCDLTGIGQKVTTNTETIQHDPSWAEFTYGALDSDGELYLDFEHDRTWARQDLYTDEFTTPRINKYYKYSCGYRITTIHEQGGTDIRKTTYLNPSTGNYEDTKPTQDGKLYERADIYSSPVTLDGYYISYYPNGVDSRDIPNSETPHDTFDNYYYIYDFEFIKYIDNVPGNTYFVRGQKHHTGPYDSSMLRANEILRVTYRTDVNNK